MTKTDPGWIFIIIIVVIIALLWKPLIVPTYSKIIKNFSNEEQIARGKEAFYDDDRWAIKGASCATCHTQGQTPPATKNSAMVDFGYKPLTGVYHKYVKGAMANDRELAKRINKCITLGSRLSSQSLSTTNVAMQDIIAYLKTLR